MIRDARLPKVALLFSVVVFLFLPASALPDDRSEALTNFASAKVVIGQPDFTSGDCNQPSDNPTASNLCEPEGGGASRKLLYIPDSGNNRVLGFKKIPKKNGASANFVLGQTDFTSSSSGTSSTTLGFPSRVATDGKHLFVVD